MATPELHRSGHTPVSPDHAAEVAEVRGDPPSDTGAGGPLPPDNRPGHHPEVEQDKPRRPPPSGGRRRRRRSQETADATAVERASGQVATFRFAFEPRLRPLALVVGVTPDSARVEVGDRDLTVRFGRWTLRTPLANVAGTENTGPYAWWKVAGPAHLSLGDGGITFATTTAGGVCISFHEPVPAIMPGSVIRHPGATVTVEDPDGLVAAIEAAQLRLLEGAAA
jgi:hypothetical protein